MQQNMTCVFSKVCLAIVRLQKDISGSSSYVWDEITYSFLDFNGATV